MIRFFLLFAAAVCAFAQSESKNTLTFSGGLANNAGNTCCGDTSPALGLTYSYRFLPHVALEAGVDSAIALGTEIRGANYDAHIGDRMFWVPFGVRGILPLRHNRIELFVSAGGLYEKYYAANPFDSVGVVSRDGWGGYAALGASVALDRSRHFWLGGSSHFFFGNSNNGYAHDRWVTTTADFSFRF